MAYLALHEQLLRRLYVGEDRDLAAVMSYMQTHHPVAEPAKQPCKRAYERFFKKKRIRKHWKADYCLWVYVRRHELRQEGNLHAVLYIDNQRIEEEVVEKRIARLVTVTQKSLVASGAAPPTQQPEGYEFRDDIPVDLIVDPGETSSDESTDSQGSSEADDEESIPTSPQEITEDEQKVILPGPSREPTTLGPWTAATLLQRIIPVPCSSEALSRYHERPDRDMLFETLQSLNACSGIWTEPEFSDINPHDIHETLALSILATADQPIRIEAVGAEGQYLRSAFIALAAVYAGDKRRLQEALTCFDSRRDDGNLLMVALFLAIRTGAQDLFNILLATFGSAHANTVCLIEDWALPREIARAEDGSPTSSPWTLGIPSGLFYRHQLDFKEATALLNRLYRAANKNSYVGQGPVCIRSLSTTALFERTTPLCGFTNGLDVCHALMFAGLDVYHIPSGSHVDSSCELLLSEGPLSSERYREPEDTRAAGLEFSHMGPRG